MVGWVAGSSALLGPLVEALARYVLAGGSINGDDPPVKVLAPGTGKTKKGQLWTYVRDERSSADAVAIVRLSPTSTHVIVARVLIFGLSPIRPAIRQPAVPGAGDR